MATGDLDGLGGVRPGPTCRWACYAATEDRTVHFNQFPGPAPRTGSATSGSTSAPGREGSNWPTSSAGTEVSKDDYVPGHGRGNWAARGPRRVGGRSTIRRLRRGSPEIDPIFFQKTYYLAPQGEGANARVRAAAPRG